MNLSDDVGFFTAELRSAAASRQRPMPTPVYHYITESGLTQARFLCGRTGHTNQPDTPGHVTLEKVRNAVFGRLCLQCARGVQLDGTGQIVSIPASWLEPA